MRSAREYSRAPKNLKIEFLFLKKIQQADASPNLSTIWTHPLTATSNSRLLLWAIIKCLCNFYPFYKTSHIFHIHRKPVYRMHQTSKNQRRGPSLQFVEGIFPKNKINMEICHYPISDFSFGPNMLGLLGFCRPYIHKHAQNMETRKC